ncbi:MAG: hypothetical protein AB1782_08995 [Cyanobacteriota bacterium]
MSDESKKLYVEKLRFSFLNIALGLLALVFLISVSSQITDQQMQGIENAMGILLIMVILFLTYANFRILKITVTNKIFEARYGLIAKKIPLETIKCARVHQYKFTDFFGWGIRGSFDGTMAFNITGDKYQGVLLVYTNSKGKEKKFFASSKEPKKVLEVLKGQNNNIEI